MLSSNVRGGRIPAIPFRCHGLSASRGADQKKIMSACHCNLRCTLDGYLTLHFRKIRLRIFYRLLFGLIPWLFLFSLS